MNKVSCYKKESVAALYGVYKSESVVATPLCTAHFTTVQHTTTHRSKLQRYIESVVAIDRVREREREGKNRERKRDREGGRERKRARKRNRERERETERDRERQTERDRRGRSSASVTLWSAMIAYVWAGYD